MFRSVKIKSIRLTLLSLIGVLLFAAVVLVALRGGASDTIEIGGEKVSLIAEDESDVRRFLLACGYDDPEFLFEHEITVPKNWNETYIQYNALQKEQGFDLVPYKGKPAIGYVYFVDETLNATVLVSDSRIIAAHICSVDGSEMKILHRKENQTQP